MKKFTITNKDNSKMTVDLVRYFKFKNDCFLVYSIGEVDEKNYMKLYLVRIMEELGFPVVQTIKNETDWKNMQGIVKKVLKELKKNSKKMTEDLDYKDIEGIKVSDPRFFKLDSKLVDILASNYMEGTDAIDTQSIPVENERVVTDNQLEPIDQTIMEQGQLYPEVAPVQPLAVESPVVSEVEQPVEAMPIEAEAITPVQPLAVESPVVPEVEQPVEAMPIEAEAIAPVQPLEVEAPVASADEDVDYKEMYLALKSDNDATNELLDSLVIELSKYKEKYGELQ